MIRKKTSSKQVLFERKRHSAISVNNNPSVFLLHTLLKQAYQIENWKNASLFLPQRINSNYTN